MNLKNTIQIILALALIFYPVTATQKLPTFNPPHYEIEGLVKYKNTYVSCSDPILMKIILNSFKRLEEYGFILPKTVVVERDEFSYTTKSPAIQDPSDGLILGDTDVMSNICYINNYSYKYDLNAQYHTIFHEIGHVNHLSRVLATKQPTFIYEKLMGKTDKEDKDFTKLKPEIELVLGKYAISSEFEFVAEYFAAMLQGQDLPDNLGVLYDKFGGPEPKLPVKKP